MEVCRLCLDLAVESDVKKLEGTYKDATQIVLPEVNTDISSSPVICQQCTSSLDELYAFKASVVEAENQIREKVGENKCQLGLKEVMTGVKVEKDADLGKSKDRMCRTCLCAIEGETFTILKPTQSDAYLNSMLLMCLPEMELELTLDPVMCEQCLCNLQKLYHFKSSCLDIEERLNSYCQQHGTSSNSQINLHSVLAEDAAESKDHNFTTVKSEPIDSSVGDYKSEEDDDDVSMSDNSKDLGYTVVKVKKEERDMMLKEEDDTEDGDESMGDDAGSITDEEIGELKQEELKIEDDDEDGTKKLKNYDHTCKHCTFSTVTKKKLYDHQRRKHPEIYRINPVRKIPCSQEGCTYTTPDKKIMREHLLRVHDVEQTDYPIYRCNQCKLKTISRHSIEVHILSHKQIRNHRCPHCPYRAKTKGTLTVHLLIHRGADKLYSCPYCTFTSIYTSSYRRHLKYVHEQQYKKCDKCDFKCRTLSMMMQHHLYHAGGPKPESHRYKMKVKCEKCGEVFSKGSLTNHIKHKHQDNPPEWQCEHCNFKTIYKAYLKEHIRNHEKNKEKNAAKVAPNKEGEELNGKMKEKQKVTCPECGKSIAKSNFSKHQKLHTDNNPRFSCLTCNYKTIYKSNMTRHSKQHSAG